ncbi:28633_t:CDS:2, partial [Dentiscutata erythropus]
FTRSDNSNNNATAKEQPSSIQNEPEYIRTPKKPKMKVTTPASSSSSTTSTKGTTNKAATTKVINSKITTSKATNSKSTSQKRTIVSMSSRKKASQPQCQHPKHSIYESSPAAYTSHPNYVSAKSIYKVNERKKLVIEMKG